MVYQAMIDPVFFCRFFLEDLFPEYMPWVHRGILAILLKQVDFLWEYPCEDRVRFGEKGTHEDGCVCAIRKIEENFIWTDQKEQAHSLFEVDYTLRVINLRVGRYTMIMMPRGSAKTTIAGIAVPLYNILFQSTDFTVYISEAAPHAKMQLHNVQRELTSNDRILECFGTLQPKLRDDQKWTGDFFETATGMAMAARGRGGQIRGMNHRGHRPQHIICDDLESKESVDTQHQREKTRIWAYGDLMPALPRLDKTATITALGTLLHSDSLLVTWMKDPQWAVVKFGVVDKDGVALWPEYMSTEDVAKEKVTYANAGQLHVFYMEYYNVYQAPEIQTFRQEFFKYNPATEDIVGTAIYMDPAISPKRTADKTAIVVAGMTQKGMIRILDIEAQRGMTEEDKIDIFFGLHKKWGCRMAGIESIAYQAALVETMRGAMFRKRHYFEIESVNNKVRKNLRIKGVLRPRFAAGYVEFRIRWPEAETELLDFRYDTDDQQDDIMDAMVGAVQLLDPYASYEIGEDKDPTKDSYRPLHEELGGNWRQY